MTDFLKLLDSDFESAPAAYGPFHLCAIALVILTAVLLSVFVKNAKDKTFRRICFVFWVILILFETYKQIIFSFNYNNAQPYWDYQWYAFPFQMCSAPIYILPFIFLSKPESAIRKATVSFMAFYILFAGIAVMVYPGDVFIRTIGIDIQTMVWHGSQVILGVYFIVYYRRSINLRFFLRAVPVFLIMVGAATALNLIIPNFTDETFNMFYISPKFPSTLPVLSSFYKGPGNPGMPWPLFLLLYLVGYTLAAFIIFLIGKGIILGVRKLCGKKSEN
ncbi:MAG: YwaF family protein [Clostridia bacterium]|nr:YwaF family protein [Clostridia bacterium]